MKIALVIPSIASVKAFFIPLMKESSGNGIELTVITSNEDRGFTWEVDLPKSVNMIYMEFPSGKNPVKWLKARRTLKRHLAQGNYDLVHAHFTIGILLLAVTPTTSKKWGTFHGVFHLVETGFKAAIVSLVEKWAMRAMNKVFVLNESDFQQLKDDYPTEKVPLPGVGVNLQHFNPSRFSLVDSETFRNALDIPEGHKVLLFVGRYTKFKGFEDALEVYKRLKKQDANISLLLCGKVDANHPLQFNIPNGVIDLGWRQDLPQIMSIANCLLFPSTREGLPVSLMEAIAMGLPYVAYNVRGVADLHASYKNGIVCTPTDVSELAVAAQSVLDEDFLMEPISELAASLSNKNYSNYQLKLYRATS